MGSFFLNLLLGAFGGLLLSRPDKITVTDYHRGDIAGSRCAVLTNAEDAGSVRDKDVSNFVRYLARGLGEAASKPKAGKVQFGDQPYVNAELAGRCTLPWLPLCRTHCAALGTLFSWREKTGWGKGTGGWTCGTVFPPSLSPPPPHTQYELVVLTTHVHTQRHAQLPWLQAAGACSSWRVMFACVVRRRPDPVLLCTVMLSGQVPAGC